MEYGLEWHRTKEELLASEPGPVLVGTPYEYLGWQSGELKQARKYASFQTHHDCWDVISQLKNQGLSHGLHEVFNETDSRCLYFDLDGRADLWDCHDTITMCMKAYVRWFFSGDRLGWDPEAVVLNSSDTSKYSCHIVFPQIQFDSYAHQAEYMPALMDGLAAIKVDLEGGEAVPLLELVVDRVPYMKFQLFRGPYACKLKNGQLRRSTMLTPEEYYENDPLSCFASFADPSRRLELPPMRQLLQWNEALRQEIERTRSKVFQDSSEHDGVLRVSPQDLQNLYLPDFQTERRGILDFVGLSEIQVYEKALREINPSRASQWWSWFRICGVTHSMLESYGEDLLKRNRIWEAHHAWSSQFQPYSAEENVEMVSKCRGKRVSGIRLLHKLVLHDNPNTDVRVTPRKRSSWSPRSDKGHIDDRVVARAEGVDKQDVIKPMLTRVMVADLHIGMPDDWKFEVSVLEKNDLRHSKKAGEYFSALLGDGSGKVRAVFFDPVAKEIHSQLLPGTTVCLRGGRVSEAKQGGMDLLFGRGAAVEPPEFS